MNLDDAEDMAMTLMEDHGLSSWTFAFDRAMRRCGQCRPSKKLITMSRHFVENNRESEVRDTILHEIAHALAGAESGHGPHWKLWAVEVGARPERCAPADVVMPQGKVEGVCGPGCEARHVRHRLPPKRTREGYSCRVCYSPITWIVME